MYNDNNNNNNIIINNVCVYECIIMYMYTNKAPIQHCI